MPDGASDRDTLNRDASRNHGRPSTSTSREVLTGNTNPRGNAQFKDVRRARVTSNPGKS